MQEENCKKHKHKMLLKNKLINEKNWRGNLQKFLETTENGNTTVQNLRDAAKGVLKG